LFIARVATVHLHEVICSGNGLEDASNVSPARRTHDREWKRGC
jgi:hypothetical protein